MGPWRQGGRLGNRKKRNKRELGDIEVRAKDRKEEKRHQKDLNTAERRKRLIHYREKGDRGAGKSRRAT